MAEFQISYRSGATETVMASAYLNHDGVVEFVNSRGEVLRRARDADVAGVDLIPHAA